MIVKLVCLFLIFFSGLYFSFYTQKKYKKKLINLKTLQKILIDINKRISRHPVSLSELFLRYTEDLYMPYNKLFCEINKQIDMHSIHNIDEIFKNCIENETYLSESETYTFTQLSDALSSPERKSISALLELAIENFKTVVEEAETELKSKCALYAKLIRLCSILLVILLL